MTVQSTPIHPAGRTNIQLFRFLSLLLSLALSRALSRSRALTLHAMDGWDPGVSFDALMARVSSNVRASTSRGTGDAGEVDASWDLSSLSRLFHQLFEEGVDEPLGGARGAGRWGSLPAASSAAVWMLAVVLRYCDDAGAPVTPDVFGSAVAGWQEVFSRAPRGTFSPGAFPFEEQLGDEAVVSWACWVAWCARHGSGRGPAGGWSNSAERTRWPADSSTSPLGASRGRSMLQAMVCCHVPCSEDHGFGAFDRLMMFLRASLWLLDAPSSSFSRWYSGQCIQRCMSLADRVHLTRDEQLMALGALADAREGTRPARQTNEGFVLTATSALTRAGGRILSPDAAIEMLRVLSSSTRRFDSTYRSLIESLMAVYTDMPDHADMVLDRWELFDPRIALAVLLPACHSLSALTITSKLAPICLNMLKACQGKAMQDDGGGRSGLLPLLQDVRIWAWCRRRCVASIILLFSRSLVLSLFCSLVHVPVSLSAPRLTAPFVAPCQVYLHGILISPAWPPRIRGASVYRSSPPARRPARTFPSVRASRSWCWRTTGPSQRTSWMGFRSAPGARAPRGTVRSGRWPTRSTSSVSMRCRASARGWHRAPVADLTHRKDWPVSNVRSRRRLTSHAKSFWSLGFVIYQSSVCHRHRSVTRQPGNGLQTVGLPSSSEELKFEREPWIPRGTTTRTTRGRRWTTARKMRHSPC